MENADTGLDTNISTNASDDAGTDNIQSRPNLEKDIQVDTRSTVSPEITADGPSTRDVVVKFTDSTGAVASGRVKAIGLDRRSSKNGAIGGGGGGGIVSAIISPLVPRNEVSRDMEDSETHSSS